MATAVEGDRRRVVSRPEQCLSFTVDGPWGHFRRVEGNIVKQTYRIIPRTTVAGLVSAVLGLPRDSYYHIFEAEHSAIAVEPTGPLRTLNLPANTLTTSSEGITKLNSRGQFTIGFPDPSQPRQQHNYEVLVDPSYRIDLWLEDVEIYEALRGRLEAGESHYVPSLGLSEYLSSIEFHGEFDVTVGPSTGEVEVDSALPEAVDAIVPRPGNGYRIERSPGYMEADGGGRRTTGFLAWAYEPEGESLLASNIQTSRVDDRIVRFV